mgnify:CR=1 FL=1
MIQGEFVNGSAIVYTKRKGELVPGLQLMDGTITWLPYNWMGQFFCDRALVRFQKYFGYIDRSGNLITPLKFIIGNDFSEDRAFATEGMNTYIIDTEGRVVRMFDEPFVTQDFRNGQAVLSRMIDQDTLQDALIDPDGEFITDFSPPRKITSIEDLEFGITTSKRDWHEGLLIYEGMDIRIIKDFNNRMVKGPNHFYDEK